MNSLYLILNFYGNQITGAQKLESTKILHLGGDAQPYRPAAENFL